MSFYIILLILGLIIFFALFIVYKYSKKKKISNVAIKELLGKLNKIIKSKNSPKEKIIDLDKLFHYILKEFGYEGTFGEILKLKPKEISDLDKIWGLHKLRNKLVHDFDIISETSLKKKVLDYEKQIRKLLR